METEKNYWSTEDFDNLHTLIHKYFGGECESSNIEMNVASLIWEYLGKPEHIYPLFQNTEFTEAEKNECDPFMSKHMYPVSATQWDDIYGNFCIINHDNDNIHRNDKNKGKLFWSYALDGMKPPYNVVKKDLKRLKKSYESNKPVTYRLYFDYSEFINNLKITSNSHADARKNKIICIDIDSTDIPIMYFGKDFAVIVNSSNTYRTNFIIYLKSLVSIPDDLKNILDLMPVLDMKNNIHIKYISKMDSNGVYSSDLNIKKVKFSSIKENYNPDFMKVNKKICKFIKEDNSGIILLNGQPGTGKTYYIRSLLEKFPDKKFTYISPDDFRKMCDCKQYLINLGKDTIFIMEDCESLIMSRTKFSINQVSEILNVTDGLLGDSINLKIICTYNTDSCKIDKALLRKGRIKASYTFEALPPDIAEKLCKKHKTKFTGKAMPLCEIYSKKETDDGIEMKDLNELPHITGFGSEK